MIANLRKIHLYVWVLVIVSLPILMFFAIWKIPPTPIEDISIAEKSIQEGRIIKTANNDLIEINLKDVASNQILEIQLKKPLKASSAVVHELKDNLSKGAVLGQVNLKSFYSFSTVTKDVKGIIIYDAIKKEQITKIKF